MSGGRRARRIATLLIRFSVELTQRMRISLCAAFTVCKAVIDTIDKSLTDEDRKDLVAIESKMFKWCAGSKGKDKTMVSSHAAARCWAAAATVAAAAAASAAASPAWVAERVVCVAGAHAHASCSAVLLHWRWRCGVWHGGRCEA